MSEERLTTEAAIRQWLLDYAWNGTEEEQAAEVDCIMSQGDVASIVDGLTERYAGMAFDDEQRLEAHGFALSSLYECHGGPHIEACPEYDPSRLCEAQATKGTGTGTCGRSLDELGNCDRASDHI